jgi:hypothetical protein
MTEIEYNAERRLGSLSLLSRRNRRWSFRIEALGSAVSLKHVIGSTLLLSLRALSWIYRRSVCFCFPPFHVIQQQTAPSDFDHIYSEYILTASSRERRHGEL